MTQHVATAPGTGALPGRRWLALVVIALAQLMIALDATIMNIALPSAQHDLGFSDADRQWVITGYTLALGGLLLLGGRIADAAGRRRAFLIGLLGFAAASALAGAANGLALLTAARALQGAFAALLAPATLALLAVTFTEARERARAFAIFGAIAGGGGALGLVLGGLLTEGASWRWCCYVNTVVAVVAAVGAWYLLPAAPGRRSRLDVPSAALVTGGVLAVVYACSLAGTRGWSAPLVLALLAASALLLVLFAVRQWRAPEPLVPPAIIADRSRAGAYLAVACAVAGMLGMFLFLTYYLQAVLGYSPLRAGLAFLPLSAGTLISSQTLAVRLLPRRPPRVLVVPGLLAGALAMLWLTRLGSTGGYVTGVLPAELLLGFGAGLVFVPAINAATAGVAQRSAGVAAAVLNTTQQVGASVGVALLNTVAASTTATWLATHPGVPGGAAAALVPGYATAAGWAAGILTAAAVLAAVLITAKPSERNAPTGQSAPAPAAEKGTT